MNTLKTLLLVLAAVLLAPLSALADDDAIREAEKLERRIRETAEKVVPAFVFVGGGSGVLISSDGWFLTNHHVIADRSMTEVAAWEGSCHLSDGRSYRYDIVGTDPVGDIALCKIRGAKDLAYGEMGDSDEIRTGESVLAVGNPFMLGTVDFKPTVSFGIVSAVHRFQYGYSDAIQTDAAVNPGNSGGPLFSVDGKLLGINGRINTRFGNRVNTGIGFAIPINQVKNFMQTLKQGGYVRHGKIKGLTTKRYMPPQPEEPNPRGDGCEVVDVSADSTAAKAGLQKGDLIVEVDGYRIHNHYRYHGVVGTYPGGATISLKVKRGEETVSLEVKLDKETLVSKLRRKGDLGATFADEEGKGVVVKKVRKDTDASRKGLKAGDVILKFNGQEVENAESLAKAVRKFLPKKVLPVVVKRGDEEIDLEIMLAPEE